MRHHFDEILEAVEATRRWYETTLHLRTRGSILDELEPRIRALCSERHPVVEQALRPVDLYAILEGVIFSKIHQGLRGLSSDKRPRKSLRKALRGPLTPQSEDRKSNEGRNHRFELEVAAELLSNGVDVTGFEDVQCTFDGKPLLLECKRPFGPRGVRENLRQAWIQIKKGAQVDRRTRGLIVISVERVYDPAPDDAESLMLQLSEEFRDQHMQFWEAEMDERVLAIVMAFKLLSRGEAVGHVAEMLNLRAILPFCPGNSGDLEFLHKLEQRLSYQAPSSTVVS